MRHIRDVLKTFSLMSLLLFCATAQSLFAANILAISSFPAEIRLDDLKNRLMYPVVRTVNQCESTDSPSLLKILTPGVCVFDAVSDGKRIRYSIYSHLRAKTQATLTFRARDEDNRKEAPSVSLKSNPEQAQPTLNSEIQTRRVNPNSSIPLDYNQQSKFFVSTLHNTDNDVCKIQSGSLLFNQVGTCFLVTYALPSSTDGPAIQRIRYEISERQTQTLSSTLPSSYVLTVSYQEDRRLFEAEKNQIALNQYVSTDSDLPISYASKTPEVCTVDASQSLQFLKGSSAGAKCVIAASQGGNAAFNPIQSTSLEIAVKDFCAGQPCQNSGRCSSSPQDQSFDCACQAGFTGAQCAQLDLCAIANPCLNEGECQLDANNNVTCTCSEHYTCDCCGSAEVEFFGYVVGCQIPEFGYCKSKEEMLSVSIGCSLGLLSCGVELSPAFSEYLQNLPNYQTFRKRASP